MKKTVKIFSSIIIAFIIGLTSVIIHYSLNLPDSFYVTTGNQLNLPCFFNIEAEKENYVYSNTSRTTQVPKTTTLKLFGFIPIKNVTIKTVDEPCLVPGGNPFGIKLLTDGVMVVGIGQIDVKGGTSSPATEAGIKVGDVIISINGQKVMSNSEIESIISQSNGSPVSILLKRNKKEMTVSLVPVYSYDQEKYKAGMYVRDSSAGIGTITFYDPQTKVFGGLGHGVCDVDTGEILPLSRGEVVGVNINGIHRGVSGAPGELLGSFVSSFAIGKLELNNNSGLFGILDSAPNSNSAIPMALKQEIELGEATIYTTLDGNSPKEYKISIEKIDLKESTTSKNMVIRIIDKELLDKTGGIVQGMSGSPIIQKGKIIGAVTHVFVNDPSKGYGIFCESMYNYANSIAKDAS